MYAFLFLTYDDPNKPQIWKKFFEKRPECNIYIHPKFKEQMRSTFKKYVISSHIETSWADISIVRGTLLLLEESFKKLDNEWFILCSNSCIPLYSFVKFKKYIADFNDKSVFNYKDKIKTTDNRIKYIIKTSQFWILNRNDVKTILNYQNKYINIFSSNIFLKKYIQGKGALDEIFFLTLLTNEINDYEFNNCESTYTKWFYKYTGVKHPINYFNFMPEDMLDFKNNNSFFVRKIDKKFNLIKDTHKYTLLLIIYIGKYTTNKLIKMITEFVNNQNIKLIIFTYGEYEIPSELIKYCYFSWNTRGNIRDIYDYIIKYERDFFIKRGGKGITFLLGDERDEYKFLENKRLNIHNLNKIAMEKDNFYFIV